MQWEQNDSESEWEEAEVEALHGDFALVQRKLRQVLHCPHPSAPGSPCFPQLTDLVKTSTNVALRPYTVIKRIYPLGVFLDVAPLPPLSEHRRRQQSKFF